MKRSAGQQKLFDSGAVLPNGFVYRPNFLTGDEEQELIGFIEDLPLAHPIQEGYPAKRRVMNFGWSYDFAKAKLVKGPALPHFLIPCARKVAKWLDIPKSAVVEALITEYPPGAAIGWHRDNELFDSIVGISLSGWCRLRLRPRWQHARRKRIARDIQELDIAPRSAYVMQHESRWDFQHSVPKVSELRYSITFRTLPKN